MRIIDIPPVDVPRAKAEAAVERQIAQVDLLNFDMARLDALNALDAMIDLFGAKRVQTMLDFKIAEKAVG